MGPISLSNWNLGMFGFCGGRKTENPEKNPQSKARASNRLNAHIAPGQN